MLRTVLAVDEGVRAAKRRGRFLLYATFPMLIALVVLAGCTTQPNHIDGATGLLSFLFGLGGVMALMATTVVGKTGHGWGYCANGMCVTG
jgi:hypothetical protein